jgi:hypothetical protein
MEDKKEKATDVKKELDKVSKSLRFAIWAVGVTVWLFKKKSALEFILSSIICAAWMSLLLFFIWTEKLIYLKIWATPLVFGLIIYFVVEGFKQLKKEEPKGEKLDFSMFTEKEIKSFNQTISNFIITTREEIISKKESKENTNESK